MGEPRVLRELRDELRDIDWKLRHDHPVIFSEQAGVEQGREAIVARVCRLKVDINHLDGLLAWAERERRPVRWWQAWRWFE